MRLVLLDVDGCLTAGEARPFDFEVMAFIGELNRRARVDAAQFAVTLCTGRPEPYVEALMQAIDGFMPAIFENGGGLYFPAAYRFAFHAAITPAMRATLAHIHNVLQRELVETGIGQFQPGKEVTATMYPARADVSLMQLAEMVRDAVGNRLDGYSIFASVSCVEIMPDGIDKGAALEWVSQETGIALSEMAGIGDAPADLSYLLKVGHSAAPANAHDEVKRAVRYVSAWEDSRGTAEIMRRWMNADSDD